MIWANPLLSFALLERIRSRFSEPNVISCISRMHVVCAAACLAIFYVKDWKSEIGNYHKMILQSGDINLILNYERIDHLGITHTAYILKI